jgi:hypothetical protein
MTVDGLSAEAPETRRVRAWAGRAERELLQQEIRELCRRLELDCEIQKRRGILRGGLTAEVSGRPEKLDMFEKEYADLLYARAEQLMDRDLRERHR